MKNVVLLSILFCPIASPTLADLTPENLKQIRLIIKEGNDPIKTEIGPIKDNVAS